MNVLVQYKEKMTITLSKDIKDYLVSQAEHFGMSSSAYITMLVNNSRIQSQALSEMSKIQGVIDQMAELVEKGSSLKP